MAVPVVARVTSIGVSKGPAPAVNASPVDEQHNYGRSVVRVSTSLAAIGLVAGCALLACFTLPASAQGGACLVGPGPDGRPLSFEQWYAQCGNQVQQVCATMRNIAQNTDCNAIARAQYQQYVDSVR
jgi:hypothetical protein